MAGLDEGPSAKSYREVLATTPTRCPANSLNRKYVDMITLNSLQRLINH